MSVEQKFFLCKKCGNLVGQISGKMVPMVCCGEEMTEIVPNTVEASKEKHLPTVNVAGSTVEVQIGSEPHPMEEAHHIQFVYMGTGRGGQRKNLKVGEAPKLKFSLTEDEPLAVYAYCNLHGLWKTVI